VAQQNEQIIGSSRVLRDVFANASRIAKTNRNVVVEGANGTGKEALARSIHDGSARKDKAFVTVNCASIPRDLLESELFGHVKGAFTGAVQNRDGAFVTANGGTLFLDEIGELELAHQPKLLRAIQQGEVKAVGSEEIKRVDVRIVAATNRNLRKCVEAGCFRPDLFFRLAGFELRLPTLHERGRDILEIAKDILAAQDESRFFGRDAQQMLLAHEWPGNVRELQNVVEAAMALSKGKRITAKVLRKLPTFASAPSTQPEPAQARWDAVQGLLAANGRVTAADVRDLFRVGKTRAFKLLEGWEQAGALVGRGAGRGAHYVKLCVA